MITLDTYKQALGNPSNFSTIRKQKADDIMNLTFTNDVGYKNVYLLTVDDGWQYVDAKYSKHSAVSISKDAVDYYLQFRPHYHVPIGSYVFVPDDNSSEIGFEHPNTQTPFEDNGFDVSKLWIIVGRTDDNQFARYMILKCNWLFKWIYKLDGVRQILSCYGCIRSANSYTSGIWSGDISTILDQITGSWVPDTYHIYGDKLEEYGLSDTRLIGHDKRFMITNNVIDPNVYVVSKVIDMAPQGLIKLTLKQDELDPKRDNVDLLLCDYYNDSGEIQIDTIEETESETMTSTITWWAKDDDGELVEITDSTEQIFTIGEPSYFKVTFSDSNVKPQWKISLIDENDTYTSTQKKKIEKMMVITKFDDTNIAIRPGKSPLLQGLSFTLSVSDSNGDYYSYTTAEVE